MSAHQIKIFIFVGILHVAILSFAWIGFPVPAPRLSPEFVYKGEGTVDENYVLTGSPVNFNELNVDKAEAPWVHLRKIEKPKSKANL
jgi:hypothetical protein